jgi:hypothetical protein
MNQEDPMTTSIPTTNFTNHGPRAGGERRWLAGLAGVITAAIAGTALWLAAAPGGAAPPATTARVAAADEPADLSRFDARADRVRQRLAEKTARPALVTAPDATPEVAAPRPPGRKPPIAKPPPETRPPVISIDPSCAAQPLGCTR